MTVEPIEPYRVVRVQKVLTPFNRLVPLTLYDEITRDLGSSEVVVTDSDAGLDEASFCIKHNAATWYDALDYGMRVQIEAGYKAKKGVSVFGKGGEQVSRVFFEGVLAHKRPVFPDNGKPELELTVKSDLYVLTKRRPGRITYPTISKLPTAAAVPLQTFLDAFMLALPFFPKDPANPTHAAPGSPFNVPPPEYSRTFHINKQVLRISDIVKGILLEYGIVPAQIKIDEAYDYAFTPADTISQNESESDFDFVQRLLTGKTELTFDKSNEENVVVNARARIFMQYNHTTKRTEAHIVPEDDLVNDRGGAVFYYHMLGSERVDTSNYDPTAKDPKLVMRNISINDNPDEAKAAPIVVHQDVQQKTSKRKGKAKRGSGAGGSRAGATADVTPGVEDEPPTTRTRTEPGGDPKDLNPPYGFELNYAKVRAAVAAGELTPEDAERIAKEAAAGTFRYEENKQWFIERDQPEASARSGGPLDGADEDPADVTPTGVPGKGTAKGTGKQSKRRKRKKNQPEKERVKKYGQELEFETHGSIFVFSRKSYYVQMGAIDGLSGDWYTKEVKHVFGGKYMMTIKMVR